jgi:hypothetical protein
MNISQLLRDSWGITWRSGPLWLLGLLLFVVFLPAGIVAGGFGAVSALLVFPWPGPQPAWLIQLQRVSGPAWLGLAAAALVVLVGTSALAWLLQAASIRGAALAAEQGSFRLGEALRLGRQRVVSVLKLSLTFGALVALLGLLPPLAAVLLQDQPGAATAVLRTTQTLLAPLNVVLGLTLLLVMMAIAVEDLRPRAAFRQAWRIFRWGWWGFVLVLGLSAAPVVLVAILLIPLVVVLPFAFLSDLGWVLAAACLTVLSPLIVGVLVFTGVFTLVLYTLIYRAASRASAVSAAAG